jgi:acyl-coenzyme A synthetase/AMP-(fatty) acid ligase
VFTSGSTGEPKGVAWTNATLLNDAHAGRERLGFAPGDRTALVLPLAFAAGLTVVVFALLNGAGVYAYDPRVLGLRDLAAWLTSQRLTTLHATPSLLRSLLGALEPDQVLPDLRLVTTCGEPVYGYDVVALRPHLAPEAMFVNWSGSSEVASLAFFEVAPGAPVCDGVLPVGWPAAGKDITIVDEAGVPVPTGETGEVMVTSAYMSAGYWPPNADMAARFTPLPDGRTAFSTGDLGRIDDDGAVALLGRRDAAAKIRGYLVEPSEVEAALLAIDEVVDAVVTGPSATRARPTGSSPTWCRTPRVPPCRPPRSAESCGPRCRPGWFRQRSSGSPSCRATNAGRSTGPRCRHLRPARRGAPRRERNGRFSSPTSG